MTARPKTNLQENDVEYATNVSDEALKAQAEAVNRRLLAGSRMLATAESCTGGWIAKAITDVPGSSAVLDRGFVTYTNQAKQEMLGVSAATLESYGAVSEPTVREMAIGALRASRAQIAVAVSGIAGPSGGTPSKPVGMVCFAWSTGDPGETRTSTQYFHGDRELIRRQATAWALRGILEMLAETP